MPFEFTVRLARMSDLEAVFAIYMHPTVVPFLGYDATEADAKIVGIVARGELCELLEEQGHGEPISVILDRTPFYGEAVTERR